MSDESKRVSIVLDSETEQKLKTTAARKGVSVEQYCCEAIGKELNSEAPPRKFSAKGMIALSNEILQGRKSATDSADLIREAREERHQDMGGHGDN